MDWDMPHLPVLHHLLELAQTHVHWVRNAIQLSHSQSSPSPPAFNLSQHQALFHRIHFLHQVAKVLELSFSISPSNEYSGLISFRIDWFDLFAVQGTLSSLLQQLIHLLKYNIFSSDIHTFIQFIFFFSFLKMNNEDCLEKLIWYRSLFIWHTESFALCGLKKIHFARIHAKR